MTLTNRGWTVLTLIPVVIAFIIGLFMGTPFWM